MDKIFIAGNVPSSKNSKIWTGKYFVNSKTVSKYIKNTKDQWLVNRFRFQNMIKDKEIPYKISLKFVRNSKRKFVKYEYLEDDNCNIIIPVFEEYGYDKENAGVYISVL